jgi:CheY-like chemotaxis protein
MSDPKRNGSDPANSRAKLVYVVDDEPMLLELATMILEPSGVRTQTFRDPHAAIEAFQSAETKPPLLITDYAMPRMNGLELMQACRRIEPGTKIMLVSGTVGPDIYKGKPDRPDLFLAKPYQAKVFLEQVQALLKD